MHGPNGRCEGARRDTRVHAHRVDACTRELRLCTPLVPVLHPTPRCLSTFPPPPRPLSAQIGRVRKGGREEGRRGGSKTSRGSEETRAGAETVCDLASGPDGEVSQRAQHA
eukprot:3120349-Rhodomonas_salina.1